MRPASLLLCALIALACTACDSEAGAVPTSDPIATESAFAASTAETAVAASPSPTASPPASRTPTPLSIVPGVEGTIPRIVRRVTDAVSAGDVEAVLALVQMTEAPCTERGGIGGPPKCWIGDRSYKAGNVHPEGTIVEAFPITSCEFGWYDREAVAGLVEGWVTGAGELYALVRLTAPPFEDESYYPDLTHAAIFTLTDSPDASRVFLFGERGLAFVHHPCILPAEDALAEHPTYRDAEVIAYGPAFDE